MKSFLRSLIRALWRFVELRSAARRRFAIDDSLDAPLPRNDVPAPTGACAHRGCPHG